MCVTSCRSNVRQDALSSEEETEGKKKRKKKRHLKKFEVCLLPQEHPTSAPPPTHPHRAQLPFVRTQGQKGQDLDVVGETGVKPESR